MTAKHEDGREHRPRGLGTAALPVLLGSMAVCFSVNDLLAARALSGSPRAWQPLAVLAMDLIILGAIWGLSRLKPSILRAAGLLLLLATVALSGFSVTVTILKVLAAANTLPAPWTWQTTVIFASNLLLGVGAIVSFLWLKPWKGWKVGGEPVSPATRRANKLFGLKELLGLLAMLALFFGAFSREQPFAIFSNSPVPQWIAMVAIASWLLARVLREWWRSSADEHERQASDFGRNAAAGFFLAVTPAWWVAARAGLVPQPDAMALWIITMVVSTIGWSWRRYN